MDLFLARRRQDSFEFNMFIISEHKIVSGFCVAHLEVEFLGSVSVRNTADLHIGGIQCKYSLVDPRRVLGTRLNFFHFHADFCQNHAK